MKIQNLIDSLNQYINPSPGLIDYLSDHMTTVTFKKGQVVHNANDICQHSYFIQSGIFRLYFIKVDGKEVSEYFGREREWINSPNSFIQQKPDDYFIDVIEDAEALSLNVVDLVHIFDHFPEMERYARMDMGSVFEGMMHRLKSLRFTTAEEKYQHFCENYADIHLRIPLHMVASYIGVSQETLSRVRSKKINF